MKTLAEIDKAIGQIRTSGAKLDKLIQDTAVAVLEHYAEHKDVRLVNRLYLALPAGSRKTAMASWLMAYAAVTPNTDKLTKAESPFKFDGDKVTKPEAAAEDKWYDHKPDKAVDQVFDLQKAVRSLIAKASKASSVTHGDVNTLKALAKAVDIPESDVPTRLGKVEGEPAPM